jgi:hypothetical protein
VFPLVQMLDARELNHVDRNGECIFSGMSWLIECLFRFSFCSTGRDP